MCEVLHASSPLPLLLLKFAHALRGRDIRVSEPFLDHQETHATLNQATRAGESERIENTTICPVRPLRLPWYPPRMGLPTRPPCLSRFVPFNDSRCRVSHLFSA